MSGKRFRLRSYRILLFRRCSIAPCLRKSFCSMDVLFTGGFPVLSLYMPTTRTAPSSSIARRKRITISRRAVGSALRTWRGRGSLHRRTCQPTLPTFLCPTRQAQSLPPCRAQPGQGCSVDRANSNNNGVEPNHGGGPGKGQLHRKLHSSHPLKAQAFNTQPIQQTK